MKTKQFLFYVLLLFQILIMKSVEAQWQIGTGFGNFGETDNNNIEAIGIGDFVNNSDEPQGALDIRIPYLYPSSLPYHPSEAFQTTTQDDYGAVWRMFTGRETWKRTEKFHIMNPDPSNPSPSYSLKDDIHLKVLQDGDGGNMDFFTSNEHWMRLAPERNSAYLGLNDFKYTNDWYPMSILHMNRKSEDAVFAQFTNKPTGYINSTQGFKVGIQGTTAELRQYADAPIIISSSTNTAVPSTLTERMRITYGTGGPAALSNMTKVSISYGNAFNPITAPLAMLNLGEGININSLGNRTWMEVGTHMVRQSDQMYVGIKDEGADHGNAVINWGDNPTNPGYGPDMLKFIFTGSYSQGSNVAKNTYDGLEIARMTATGNMGIGTGWNNTTILPKRRLDIVDNTSSGGSGSNYPDHVSGPQLRLTYTVDPSITGGAYTDFGTNSVGDLNIEPIKSGGKQNVGIHRFAPISTLHVGGIPGSTGAITSDYLSHPPSSFPYLVYSDANGTLNNLAPAPNSSFFLQGDGTWGSPGSTLGVTACPGVLTNYISLFDASSNICKSDLYNVGQRVGLNTTSPLAAFHTIANPFDASFIAANSSGNYAMFANQNNHVSIGANSTWGAGARLWVKGLSTGSTSPSIGLMMTDASDHPYFETNDDGMVLVGRFHANNGWASGPEGRMAINLGGVDPLTNLDVHTHHNTSVGGHKAFNVSNSDWRWLLTAWADHRITMGYNGPQTLGARLIVDGFASSPGDAAYFNGDVFFNGAWQSSDSTLKKNILSFNDAISIVKSLEPKKYEFDISRAASMNLDSRQHYGFLSQDVERILPDVVAERTSPTKYDTAGNVTMPGRTFKAMNYIEIIPILTAAIQEQQVIIDSLSRNDSLVLAKIEELQDAINSCCSTSSHRIGSEPNSIDVELSSENAIILNQNDPNPFNERTRISYNIPESVKKAEVIFYTSSGIVLKSIIITTRGLGEMNVFASDLSSGMYMYTLRADGNMIDTKKMICTK